MKLEELHLIAFGPFTDRTLDFSAPGLQLIFGRNEAGKSSALRAINSLLFGIPGRTGDTFLHRKDDLRIGAKITNKKGNDVTFARRKGKLKSLVSLDENETFLSASLLDEFLLGLEQQRFQDIYCIDHPELRAGGELMRELKGLAGESLLVASTSSDLPRIENQLQDDINSLFVARGRKNKIKAGISDYQSAKKEKTEHEVRVSKWTKLQAALDEQEQRKSALREKTSELRADQSRLERLRDALPKIAEWKRVNDELLGKDVQILPDTYSIQNRQQCQAELRSIESRIAELQDETKLLQTKLTKVSESPLLLAETQAIEALQQRIGAQAKAQEERRSVADAVEVARREVDRLLKEIDTDIAFENIEELRLRKEHRVALFELAESERSIREKPLTLATEREQNEREIARLQKQLADCGATVSTTSLERVLREVASLGDVEEELVSLQAERQSVAKKTVQGMAALPLWNGSLEQLASAKLPLRETIDQYAQATVRLAEKQEATRNRLSDVRRDYERLLEAIDATKKATAVVTEDDLQVARNSRDQLWEQVRTQLFEGKAVTKAVLSLFGPFGQATTTADEIADRLRREADRVAELAQRETQAVSLEKQVAEISTKLESLQQEGDELQAEWNQAWSTGGVSAPRSAKEMAAWLDQKHILTAAGEQLQAFDRQMAKLNVSIDDAKSKLGQALREIPLDDRPESDSLRDLVSAAHSFVEEERTSTVVRDGLQKDLERLNAAVEASQREEKSAQEKLDQWQQDWSTAMTWIACGPETSSALARARVECLDELTQRHELWRQSSQRIRSIDADEEGFTQEVAGIAARAEIEIADWAPIDTARRLKTWLDEARKENQTAETLRNAIAAAEEKICELRTAEKQNTSQLSQFLSLAGVESNDSLPHIESQSDLALVRRKLRDEIQRIGGGGEFNTFLAAAENTDINELTARLTQLEEEIQEQVDQTDLIVARITEIRNEMDAIDGNASTAEADQRAMTCLASVHELSRRYAKLKIAQALLRQHIERYQEENRDPLLAKASDYFATMTCNEFLGLQIDYDDNNRPIIHGVRNNRQLVDVTAMSDGTRDPMFLALRLAYIQKRLGTTEPMPFIVDDILIHLDDDRATATLQVLAGLAQETQVLFFTHHDRLRDLAERNLPTNQLAVHELEVPARAGTSSPRRPK